MNLDCPLPVAADDAPDAVDRAGLPFTASLPDTAAPPGATPRTGGRRPREGRLELWAGPEPSVVRIHDRRTDQLGSTGFAHRLDDLDRLASLGATRVRMPVLWERTETPSGELDFAWADSRMERLRRLGLAAIVGLVHHGSGPLHTHLLDPAFPAKLADYAARVAERYPWVDAWTPVNEPLTTARFSALYGHWYPHCRDDASFVRALLLQVQATRLAMRRIRAVVPQARLVQTEDLGRTTGTAAMRDQVRFDNHRRWLSLDLLCGRVDAAHPMRDYLEQHGATPSELDELQADPTPPDVIGINHYITSDRFLDHRLGRYPARLQARQDGRNRRWRPYVDVETVRVDSGAIGGFRDRLGEAARRYRLPLAITEVQMSCTREEQLRWFHEAWTAAAALRADGVDVRGVTAWAAFGSQDWNSLLTEDRGVYVPGLFDVRSPEPRPTELATLATELAHGREPSHPVLASPGWWHRAERHTFAPHGRGQALHAMRPCGAPLLIVGGRGALGQAFARLCRQRGLAYAMPGRDVLDVTDPVSVAAALDRWSPWAVIDAAGGVRAGDAAGGVRAGDAAGGVRVDDARHDTNPDRRTGIDIDVDFDTRRWVAIRQGPALLAAACRRAGARLLTFSSDQVFDGTLGRPYVESDAPRPLDACGRAQHAAEQAVGGRPGVLVVRSAALFGPWDSNHFLAAGLAALHRGETWAADGDRIVSPTYLPDLVHTALDLLIDGEEGLWHLANRGAVSWHEFACRAAEAAGLPRAAVQRTTAAAAGEQRTTAAAAGEQRTTAAAAGEQRTTAAAAGEQAPTPACRALASERGELLPTLDAALLRFVHRADGHDGDSPPAARFGEEDDAEIEPLSPAAAAAATVERRAGA